MKKIKRRWLLPSMLLLVMSLVLTGCTPGTDNPPAENPSMEENAEDVKDEADDAAKDAEDAVREMTYEDIVVTAEEAFDKFMELHPDAMIKKLDLDKELVEYQYVVEGYDNENSYEVKINPVDGEVISDDSEVIDMENDNAVITKDHLAKADSIIDKAKTEDGSDSELDEWTIYAEDGKVIMDVEIGATVYSYDMDSEELIDK